MILKVKSYLKRDFDYFFYKEPTSNFKIMIFTFLIFMRKLQVPEEVRKKIKDLGKDFIICKNFFRGYELNQEQFEIINFAKKIYQIGKRLL